MPSIPDFETLFSQVQLFISTCNGEHIRYATDTCKLSLLSDYIFLDSLVLLIFFFTVFFFVCLFFTAFSCWPVPPVNKCPCGEKTGEQVSSSTNKLPAISKLLKGMLPVSYSLHKDLPLTSG